MITINSGSNSGLLSIGLLLRTEAFQAIRLDVECLLAYVLNVSRPYLHTWPEQAITPEQKKRFDILLERRIQGEPLAYIVGYQEFWSLPLMVSKAVLIPRPETELLVEQVLAFFPKTLPNIRLLDLGTGSGAIALALASERPDWQITAVDKSLDALCIAKKNAQDLNIQNVELYQSDWFSAVSLKRQFDIIVGNPPYIAPMDIHLQQAELKYEPKEALVSSPDGLEDCRKIIQMAPRYLALEGWLMLEHGYDQGPAMIALMKDHGFTKVQDINDLAGLSRLTIGRKS